MKRRSKVQAVLVGIFLIGISGVSRAETGGAAAPVAHGAPAVDSSAAGTGGGLGQPNNLSLQANPCDLPATSGNPVSVDDNGTARGTGVNSNAATSNGSQAKLDGGALFRTNCLNCHNPRGKAKDIVLSAKSVDAKIRAIQSGKMPKGKSLTPAQQDAIISYLRTQG